MSIVRVRYRERQRLSAADMRLEQDYLLRLGGRHDLAHHDWGIVAGLRILKSGADFLLSPGFAVDGFGREIVVPHPLPLELASLDLTLPWYVQLCYCEDAQYPGASAHAVNAPATRIAQRPVIVVTADAFTPEPTPDALARARAAGSYGLEPWPVVVATFGTDPKDKTKGPEAGYAATRYATHRASSVHAPNARAFLQLGVTGSMDFFHFLLSTGDGTAAAARRIGVDRHACAHVWGCLRLLANRGAARIAIGYDIEMRITAPMPASIGSSALIAGTLNAKLSELTASLRVSGATTDAPPAHTPLERGHEARLSFQDGHTGTVEFLDTSTKTPMTFRRVRQRVRNRVTDDLTFSAQMSPFDARLAVVSEHGAPSALVLRPAKEVDADPSMREIHAIETTHLADATPSTELRLAGGVADDADAATHVGIGARIDGLFRPVLDLVGQKRVEIRTLADTPDERAPASLTVTRSVYLPAIGPKDPLLPELMMLAYIGGLRRIGNITTLVTVKLKLPGPPTAGASPANPAPSYVIEVELPESSPPYTIKRVIELITGEHGKGALTFRTLKLPAPKTAENRQIRSTVPLPKLGRAARRVEVVVLALIEFEQRTTAKNWIAESKPLLIPLGQ